MAISEPTGRRPPPSGCPSCGSGKLGVFYEQDSVPVHSCRLVETHEEALAFPRGTLRLAFCAACGFITNAAHDPSLQDYGIGYEETQAFSPRFVEFARELAQRWIERHDLRDKVVLEIGCGKGEFLALMCELGPNRGVGVDPAFVPARLESTASARMRFIRDVYDDRYADIAADAVVCRHTLEHIAPVGQFMALVRRTTRTGDPVVLFDVPDVVRVLREGAFWDLYYEHCSYFSAGSLARLFRNSGFDVLDLTLEYGDQYLVLEARPGTGDQHSLAIEEQPRELAEDVHRFGLAAAGATDRFVGLLSAARGDGGRVALWGAGSKAVAFLTALAPGDAVSYAVDVNPFKQGKFIAGTGHRVLSPDSLPDEPPDVVIVMNPIYLDEVRGRLAGLRLDDTHVVTV